jgi:PAS domain S-box-containing protein
MCQRGGNLGGEVELKSDSNTSNIITSRGRCTETGSNFNDYTSYSLNYQEYNVNIGFYEQLFKDNYFGLAVYSVPDFILIKANERYLSFFQKPFSEPEHSIGKSARILFKDYFHSEEEALLIKEVQETQTVYYKEVKFEKHDKEAAYFNFTCIPIVKEGEVKFILAQGIDVTESVMSRKILEEQNRLIQKQNAKLEVIFDSIADMMIIIDTKGNFKKVNNKTKELFGCDDIRNINDLYAMGEFYNYEGKRLAIDDMHCFKIEKEKCCSDCKYKFRKDGNDTYLDICTTPIYDNEGNITSGIIVGHDVTEHVKAFDGIMEKSRKIEQQKKELKIIFDITPVGLSIVGGNGKYMEVNKRLKNALETNIVESVGQSMPKCAYFDLHGNEFSLSELPTSRILRGEQFIDDTIIMRVGDRETYHCISGIPMFNEDGSFYKGIITSNDITETIRKTQALEQKEAELRAIIESMTDALFTVDTNHRVTLINKGAQALSDMPDKVHYAEDSFPAAKFYDLDGKLVPLEKMPASLVLRGERLKTYRISKVNSKGTYHLSYSGSPIYDENGKVTKAVICAREITETVNCERLITNQRDNLYRIINEIECPIARLSYPDLKAIQINNSIVEFLKKYIGSSGVDFESLSKMSLYDFEKLDDIERSMLCIKQAAESKNSVHLENEKVVIEGNERCFNTIYQPIFGLNNEVVEILIVLIDITKEVGEKKEVERMLEKQAEFFSFIAHEFRTPLTTISSTLQLLDLVYSKEMTPNVRKYINIIRRSTFQQLRLVNNLLDITRAEAGYLKIYRKNHDIVNVTKGILGSIKPFALDKNIKLRFKSAFTEKITALDDEKYERILLNLLSNAIKFTPSDKTISVTLSSNEGKLFICVKDNGIGIPKDKQDYIFERFGQSGSRRSRGGEGTGIGLYLVKLLVGSMNGEISLSSTEKKGSTFIISLPEEVLETEEIETLPELTNTRLIQGMQLEFSNIYDH